MAVADNTGVMPIGGRLARNQWPREGTVHHTLWQRAYAGWGMEDAISQIAKMASIRV